MKQNPFFRKHVLIIALVILTITFLTECFSDGKNKVIIVSNSGQQYVGSTTCRSCHQTIYDSFISTAHYLTSRIAEKKYIAGSFSSGENTFALDQRQEVCMQDRDNGFFQVALIDGSLQRAERFDIVIGSGKKGQSYLFWKDRALYQLPVSWFAGVHNWTGSPGYPTDRISFDRRIEPRCLECHSTFVKELPGYEYPKDQIVYGVECERCHGPAGKHVAWHQ